MSDDFEDELLQLVDTSTDKKRKRDKHKSSSSKKRRTSVDSDSEDDVESEEDTNPYPLLGKYKNEEDMERLLDMNEIDREEILTSRLEEKERRENSKKLADMVKMQKGGAGGSESVSNAAKRPHAVRGATKEKDKSLGELKARREAKAAKRSVKDEPDRERSASEDDMDMSESEDDDEDGQISKSEQADERERRLLGQQSSKGEPAILEDFWTCQLSRDSLVKYFMTPWFDELAKGSWVRYLIGQEADGPVYRMCEVASVCSDSVKPYTVDGKVIDQTLELKFGSSTKTFQMDKVSNAKILPKEFERLLKVCEIEKVKLPTKRELEEKSKSISRSRSNVMTDKNITEMIERKRQLTSSKPIGSTSLEKSRLTQERTLAFGRQDYDAVKAIDVQLAAFAVSSNDDARGSDVLAKLSEKNRKANVQATRRAELLESERRKRERQLAKSGTSTPTDPHARLKAVPKSLLQSISPSRPGTPDSNATGKSPAHNDTRSSIVHSASMDSLDVDLGDF